MTETASFSHLSKNFADICATFPKWNCAARKTLLSEDIQEQLKLVEDMEDVMNC